MESLSLSHSVVNNLNATFAKNEKIQRHLQTGRRVMDNYDDAGAMSLIAKLNSTHKRNQAVQKNLQGALSFLQSQDGIFSVIGKVLSRTAELKTKFESAFADDSEKKAYDFEFRQLQEELRQIAQSKFNGVSMFSTQDSKTLFGTAVDGKQINQSSSDDGSGNTVALSRWGIYHIEPPIPPPSPYGMDFMAITLSDESAGGGATYWGNDMSDPANRYSTDIQRWTNFLDDRQIDGQIAVVVNSPQKGGSGTPTHADGGGPAVPEDLLPITSQNDGTILKDNDGNDFAQIFRPAGRDEGVDDPVQHKAQADFLMNEVLKPMIAEHGIPKAMAIFVDNSGSLFFNDVNQGLIQFLQRVKADYPEIKMPSETDPVLNQIDGGFVPTEVEAGGPLAGQLAGQDIAKRKTGFFRGIRLAGTEDWVEQSRFALEQMEAKDPDLFAAMALPDGPDPTYELDDYTMDDMIGFIETLASARGQNGAEQSRVEYELTELQAKQEGLDKALENADGLDYSLAMTRHSSLQNKLHMNVNLVAAAREMENVLYTQYLGE